MRGYSQSSFTDYPIEHASFLVSLRKEVIRLLTLFKREEIRFYLSRSWSVSWPLTLIMVFEFLIGLTDVYIAGRVSKEIQATYGFVIQLYFIFIVIANALTVGTVSRGFQIIYFRR